jgi:hypothetical protein
MTIRKEDWIYWGIITLLSIGNLIELIIINNVILK